MIVPLNPIRATIVGAAFGAGVTMIMFGAIKGALDIINESNAKNSTAEPAAAPSQPESPADPAENWTV